MSRGLLLFGVLTALTCASGCRCFPGFACYANFMDDVADDDWCFDQWYTPRLDISRAGKPDWCGPINRTLSPCRCCGKGTWGWADPCWRYPGRTPYYYPGQVVPPPGMLMMNPAEPPAAVPVTPQLPVMDPLPIVAPPKPFEDPAAPAPANPPLQAPPLPDPQAFLPPDSSAPVFEPPLQ